MHEIKLEKLITTNVFKILVGLLASAGKITSVCVVAVIESTLQPVFATFCKLDITDLKRQQYYRIDKLVE